MGTVNQHRLAWRMACGPKRAPLRLVVPISSGMPAIEIAASCSRRPSPRIPGGTAKVGAVQPPSNSVGSQMKDAIPGRRPATSDAALGSGEVGPREAECFANLANRIRVDFVVRSNQRHFSSSPLAVDCQSSVTPSASFVLGIEATPPFA